MGPVATGKTHSAGEFTQKAVEPAELCGAE